MNAIGRAFARFGIALFMIILLVPLGGLLAPIGPWHWDDGRIRGRLHAGRRLA